MRRRQQNARCSVVRFGSRCLELALPPRLTSAERTGKRSSQSGCGGGGSVAGGGGGARWSTERSGVLRVLRVLLLQPHQLLSAAASRSTCTTELKANHSGMSSPGASGGRGWQGVGGELEASMGRGGVRYLAGRAGRAVRTF